MPSPVAHVAAGIAMHALLGRRLARGRIVPPRTAYVAASLLPDVDVLPGLLFGDPMRFHNDLGGSPVFAALLAVAIGGAGLFLRAARAGGFFLIALVCGQIHVWMDFFAVGPGVMLAWPATDQRFLPSVNLFYGVRWTEDAGVAEHLLTIGSEVLTFIPILLAVRWWKARRRHDSIGRQNPEA